MSKLTMRTSPEFEEKCGLTLRGFDLRLTTRKWGGKFYGQTTKAGGTQRPSKINLVLWK